MSSTALNTTSFPPVRACIFDVDGLLINSEDIYTEAYSNILHEFGRPDYPWSVKATEQSRGRQGALRLLEWAQIPLSLSEFGAKVFAQRELFRKSKTLPGVPELLRSLSTQTSPPLHLALASSSSRDLFVIKTSHLPAITSAIPEAHRVFGNDADMSSKAGKPAPDIFLLALQRINDNLSVNDPTDEKIRPEECLVFEDSIAGVEAGRKAGMRVVWVPHAGLLDVCQGREEMVLAGTTEEPQNRTPLGVAAEMDAAREERRKEARKEMQNHDAKGSFLRSEDGWADLLTSLESFPFQYYGIHLQSSNED